MIICWSHILSLNLLKYGPKFTTKNMFVLETLEKMYEVCSNETCSQHCYPIQPIRDHYWDVCMTHQQQNRCIRANRNSMALLNVCFPCAESVQNRPARCHCWCFHSKTLTSSSSTHNTIMEPSETSVVPETVHRLTRDFVVPRWPTLSRICYASCDEMLNHLL